MVDPMSPEIGFQHKGKNRRFALSVRYRTPAAQNSFARLCFGLFREADRSSSRESARRSKLRTVRHTEVPDNGQTLELKESSVIVSFIA